MSDTRAVNSFVFAEMMFVCVVTTASATALAAFLTVSSSGKSAEEQPGDRLLGSRLVKASTKFFARPKSGELDSIAFVRSVMLVLRSSQFAGVGYVVAGGDAS